MHLSMIQEWRCRRTPLRGAAQFLCSAHSVAQAKRPSLLANGWPRRAIEMWAKRCTEQVRMQANSQIVLGPRRIQGKGLGRRGWGGSEETWPSAGNPCVCAQKRTAVSSLQP
jgi:hypothetical protein